MSTNVIIPVHSYKGNKNKRAEVGIIDGDTYKSVRRDNHFFRIFKGFGLSIDVYNFLMEHNVTKIRLYHNNKTYDSNISQWTHTSHWDNEIKKTKDSNTYSVIDPQYVLELDKMTATDVNIQIDYLKGGINMEPDLDKLGAQKGGSTVDLEKYDKKLTTIENVELLQMPGKFTELIPGTQEHYLQYCLKVSSVVLESIREGPDKIEFRATELFNLMQDKKGELIGFSTGDKSKIMKLIKELKIPNPDSLSINGLIKAMKGKEILIKSDTKIVDGKTRTYLRFRY